MAETVEALPPALLPRTEAQTARIHAQVTDWLGAGWTPVTIVRGVTEHLRPGRIGDPAAVLPTLLPPRPPRALHVAPAEEAPRCESHPYEPAASCRGCAADRKAGGAA